MKKIVTPVVTFVQSKRKWFATEMAHQLWGPPLLYDKHNLWIFPLHDTERTFYFALSTPHRPKNPSSCVSLLVQEDMQCVLDEDTGLTVECTIEHQIHKVLFFYMNTEFSHIFHRIRHSLFTGNEDTSVVCINSGVIELMQWEQLLDSYQRMVTKENDNGWAEYVDWDLCV
jgi:hypothetical protein